MIHADEEKIIPQNFEQKTNIWSNNNNNDRNTEIIKIINCASCVSVCVCMYWCVGEKPK